MNCQRCLEDISAYIDGMLPPETHEQISRHLAQCDDCAKAHGELLQLQALMAGMECPVPEGFGEAWRERLRKQVELDKGADTARKRKRNMPFGFFTGIAAAVAVCVLGISSILPSSAKQQAALQAEDNASQAQFAAAGEITKPLPQARFMPLNEDEEGVEAEPEAYALSEASAQAASVESAPIPEMAMAGDVAADSTADQIAAEPAEGDEQPAPKAMMADAPADLPAQAPQAQSAMPANMAEPTAFASEILITGGDKEGALSAVIEALESMTIPYEQDGDELSAQTALTPDQFDGIAQLLSQSGYAATAVFSDKQEGATDIYFSK